MDRFDDSVVRGYKIVKRTEPEMFVIFGIAMIPFATLFVVKPLLFWVFG